MALGMYKGRWRRLATTLTVPLEWVPTIVYTTCILHNLCIQRNDLLPTNNIQEYVDIERAFKQDALEGEAVSEYNTPVSRYFQERERVAKIWEGQKAVGGHCILFPREDTDTVGGKRKRERSAVERYRDVVADWLYAHVKYAT